MKDGLLLKNIVKLKMMTIKNDNYLLNFVLKSVYKLTNVSYKYYKIRFFHFELIILILKYIIFSYFKYILIKFLLIKAIKFKIFYN